MAQEINYKEIHMAVGDTVSLTYKLREGDKERQQIFKGVLMGFKGKDDANRMITVRKISRSGIGVERIIPLMSPSLVDIKVIKKTQYHKAKVYFIRKLTEIEARRKLYQQK